MKTLLKIISLLLLVSISLFADTQKIDESKVDLYYANGIMIDMTITKAKHELRWKDTVKKLFLSNPEEYKKIANAKISYNASQGFLDDLFEATEQAISNEWGWEEFSKQLRTFLETVNVQESYDSHIPDLTKQVEAYKESIKLGHGVIVVAHSQGNYYTNEAYELLKDENSNATADEYWMQDYFSMIGVAIPANHVAGYAVDDATAPYVLFHDDFINAVTPLPSNMQDPMQYGFPSIDAHDFYQSYLEAENSKQKIYDYVLKAIHKHDYAVSQWEMADIPIYKKSSGGHNRSYALLKVKHKFDDSIVMNETVYPFNAGQKLYHVMDTTGGSGWVQASIGGTKVVDSWSGKAEDQVYKIDNNVSETINFATPITSCFTQDNFWNNFYKKIPAKEVCYTAY